MAFRGGFTGRGFEATASSALELVVGTEAVAAQHIGSELREMASGLNANLAGVDQRIAELAQGNLEGFENLGEVIGSDLDEMGWLAGASVVVQALGFAHCDPSS